MPVSDPDVSRPRLIRDASFLEADRREIALRRGRHNANRELGRALKTEFVLQYMSEPQLRAKVRRGLLKVEQFHAVCPVPPLSLWLLSGSSCVGNTPPLQAHLVLDNSAAGERSPGLLPYAVSARRRSDRRGEVGWPGRCEKAALGCIRGLSGAGKTEIPVKRMAKLAACGPRCGPFGHYAYAWHALSLTLH